MITLRLDAELEENIIQVAKQMGVSKSELIRTSISEFIKHREVPSAWDLGQDVFGQYASEDENLASHRKALLIDKISEKYAKDID